MKANREKIHDQIRLVFLLLFTITLPYSLLINTLCIYPIIANWLFESTFKQKFDLLRVNRIFIAYFLFFLLYILSLLYTDNKHQGFFEIEKKLSLFFLPLIMASTKPLKFSSLKLILKAFVLTCLTAGAYCFFIAIKLNIQEGHTPSYIFNAIFNDIHLPGRYYYFNYWYFTNKLFANAIGIHPVYFAMYIVFSSCIVVWFWQTKSNKTRKYHFAVLSILFYNFVLLLLLASRTQVLSFAVLTIFYVTYQAYKQKFLIKAVVVLSIMFSLGITIIYLNPILKERFIDSNKPGVSFEEHKYGEGGLSLRMYKWKYSTDIIREHLWLGVSPGDSQDELQHTYLKNGFTIGFENNFNSHNQYLQLLLELGLVGILLYLYVLFLSFKNAVLKSNLLHLAFLLIFSISCITESMLENNKGIVFFAFFNSIFCFLFAEPNARE